MKQLHFYDCFCRTSVLYIDDISDKINS